jgi:hypothetical protein
MYARTYIKELLYGRWLWWRWWDEGGGKKKKKRKK